MIPDMITHLAAAFQELEGKPCSRCAELPGVLYSAHRSAFHAIKIDPATYARKFVRVNCEKCAHWMQKHSGLYRYLVTFSGLPTLEDLIIYHAHST